ncbi:hypothetical protein CROQUDRAFT_54620 [Cronartium quercuum f. sp. fusiforme G11]|uniref:DNA polymerase V n=1 Tax=Cronartium quercuum f. sp. fusiforme G11 TaxID=708437 RepID=A0A9P6N668_9BASI|nr:hypothetical protein CROQUDRAFT_54620 [Cronartium quercuum f. sp. fusiforme G11]
MSSEIMSLFGNLSNPHLDQRISSGKSIINHLITSTQESNNINDHPDFQYTIKRLIRALASPTVGARLGFSVTLTEILSKFPQLSPKKIYDLLKSSTTIQSGIKPSEEKDLLLGRLFGIKAIALSGILFKPTSSSDESLSSLELWNALVKDLSYLSSKRAWLSESVGWVLICGMLENLLKQSKEQIAWKSDAINYLIQKYFINYKSWDLEKLSMGIVLQRYNDSSINWNSILSDDTLFPVKKILSNENYNGLLKLLTINDQSMNNLADQQDVLNQTTKKSLELSTQPHFIHSIIISFNSDQKFCIARFYSKVFEDYHFKQIDSTTSNHLRKSQGLIILNHLINSSKISSSSKHILLTPSTIYTLMVQLSGKDRILHKMSRSVINNILEQVKINSNEDGLAKSIVNQIKKTLLDFDQRSRTKTLETLLIFMSDKEIESWSLQLIKDLITIFQSSSNNDDLVNNQISETSIDDKLNDKILSLLCLIIHNPSIKKTNNCIQSILKVMIAFGFFGILPNNDDQIELQKKEKNKTKYNEEDEISNKTNSDFFNQCRTRFYTCLSDLFNQTITVKPRLNKSSSTKTQIQSIELNYKLKWTTESLEMILNYIKKSNRTLLLEETNTSKYNQQELIELNRLRQIGIKLIKKINQCPSSSDQINFVIKKESLIILCESILLLSFDNHDDMLESLGLLERLDSHYEPLLNPTLPTEKTSKNDPDESSIEVLIEILIHLLSWPIAFIRNIVEHVFINFIDNNNVNSLQLLIDQMIPSNSTDADLDLISDDDEMIDGTRKSEGTVEEDSSTSSDNDDEDDDESSVSSIDEAFRDEVATALANALAKDEDGDEHGSDASSDLMNDDEMLALDSNLSTLFQRRTGKAVTKAQNIQDLHLRLKLSELISKFIKFTTNPFLISKLIIPILNLIKKPIIEEDELNKKNHKILNEILNLPKKKFLINEIQYQTILKEDEWLINFKRLFNINQNIQSNNQNQIKKLSNRSVFWFIELAINFIPEMDLINSSSSKVSVEMNQLTLNFIKEFCLKKNSKVQLNFFFVFFQKFPSLNWNLKSDLLNLFMNSNTINDYRRFQILKLLFNLLKSYHQQQSSTSTQAILEFIPEVKTHLISFLKQSISSTTLQEKQIDITRLKDFLKLLKEIINLTINLNSNETIEIWKFDEISELSELSKLRNSGSINDLFKQILSKVNSNNNNNLHQNKGKGKEVIKRKFDNLNSDSVISNSIENAQVVRVQKPKKKKRHLTKSD